MRFRAARRTARYPAVRGPGCCKSGCLPDFCRPWLLHHVVRVPRSAPQEFRVDLCLQPGEYGYQFIVDGSPKIRGDLPHGTNDAGWSVNQLTVGPSPAFNIFYSTGWERCQLVARHLREDGSVDPDHAVRCLLTLSLDRF